VTEAPLFILLVTGSAGIYWLHWYVCLHEL